MVVIGAAGEEEKGVGDTEDSNLDLDELRLLLAVAAGCCSGCCCCCFEDAAAAAAAAPATAPAARLSKMRRETRGDTWGGR